MDRKGFTIIEMVVVCAIFMILSGIILLGMNAGQTSWDIGSTYLTLQQETRRAMSVIINELSQSHFTRVIVTPCGESYRCLGDYIEFQVPVADDSVDYGGSIYTPQGNIKWGADGKIGDKITIAMVTTAFSPEHNMQLVRLTPKAPYVATCGDGFCDLDAGEMSESCPADCPELNNPGGTCLVAGTPVLMADGKSKMIEDIKIGEMVLAFDKENNRNAADPIKKIKIHRTDKYLLINNRLGITANHPVYSNGKIIPVGQLKVGDTLTNKAGLQEKIFDIKEIQKPTIVYDLVVNPYHNYYADYYNMGDKTGWQAKIKPKSNRLWACLDRFKFLGLALAQGDDLGLATDYNIRPIANNMYSFTVTNPSALEANIRLEAHKQTLAGPELSVVMTSSVTFRN